MQQWIFLLKMQGNIAQLLSNVMNNFSLISIGRTVVPLSQDLHEVSLSGPGQPDPDTRWCGEW